mmetsp:Transcript_94168/g.269938  ORF Transcript_94168/g.269938 Transcript_94168/m.269938 type:complete len:201 (+) Transcript_94168:976-1578(+)
MLACGSSGLVWHWPALGATVEALRAGCWSRISSGGLSAKVIGRARRPAFGCRHRVERQRCGRRTHRRIGGGYSTCWRKTGTAGSSRRSKCGTFIGRRTLSSSPEPRYCNSLSCPGGSESPMPWVSLAPGVRRRALCTRCCALLLGIGFSSAASTPSCRCGSPHRWRPEGPPRAGRLKGREAPWAGPRRRSRVRKKSLTSG